MADLFVLTSLDQLLLILKIRFTFVAKQATLKRRSTVLSLPLKLMFPSLTNKGTLIEGKVIEYEVEH